MGITGQILGGFCLDLKERFPDWFIELSELAGDPAILLNTLNCWIVVDGDMFKVVVALATPPVRMIHRMVLFEYSFVEPDSDFEPLFEFLRTYDS